MVYMWVITTLNMGAKSCSNLGNEKKIMGYKESVFGCNFIIAGGGGEGGSVDV